MVGSSGDTFAMLSREMSYILRHNPPAGMDSAGWVPVSALIESLKKPATFEDIKKVVEQNDKARFVLDEESDPVRIRAAQGHSVNLTDPELQPVTDAEKIPVAIHVTGDEGWRAIQSSGELKRMKRTHIHFATKPSHMRRNDWANILLQLDLKAAMEAGHSFSVSTNEVLLCEGPLPVAFVKRVPSNDLPEEWQAARPSPTLAPTSIRIPSGNRARGRRPQSSKEPREPRPDSGTGERSDRRPQSGRRDGGGRGRGRGGMSGRNTGGGGGRGPRVPDFDGLGVGDAALAAATAALSLNPGPSKPGDAAAIISDVLHKPLPTVTTSNGAADGETSPRPARPRPRPQARPASARPQQSSGGSPGQGNRKAPLMHTAGQGEGGGSPAADAAKSEGGSPGTVGNRAPKFVKSGDVPAGKGGR